MKFFKGKKINSIVVLIVLFILFFSYMVSIVGDEDIVYNFAKPMINFFSTVIILLIILYLFPVKVFKSWFFFGPILLILGLFIIFQSPTNPSCWAVCFNRDVIAGQIGIYLFLISFPISLITAFIWHLIEKRKNKIS